jgi:KUP system potassium uptake protein
MVLTSIMAFFVMRKCWNWSVLTATLVIVPFMIVELIFLAANMLKIVEGGWIPLLIGGFLMIVMVTWRRGSKIVATRTIRDEIDLGEFVTTISASSSISRVRGMAVFLTGNPNSTPTALMHNLKHNKVLHDKNIILRVVTEDVPRVADSERATVETVTDSLAKVTLRFGYMETPNVPRALVACRPMGLAFDIMSTSFFLSRRVVRSAPKSEMPRWQNLLFINMAKWSDDASLYFQIPTGRAVEVGMQINV